MNTNRGRYPPGVGTGRGAPPNPDYHQSYRQQQPPQDQQYVQRGYSQNPQQMQLQQQHQQQQQQQQWSRRPQLPGNASNANEVVQQTTQPEASSDAK